MPTLAELARGLRSKNAGPFWITIDIFFDTDSAYHRVATKLDTQTVATALSQKHEQIKRFDLPEIRVIKFSFPRPRVQGDRFDRDMHGAQYAWLLNDIEVS